MYIPKKIIVCCDGTWNQPEKKVDDRKYKPTNVLKAMRAILPTDGNNRHQIVFYDSGVGTDRGVWDKYMGGVIGVGLSSHAKKAYRFIANNYHNGSEGDELFLFGFSRGAYTARVLAAMIGTVGLLKPEDMTKLPEVYKYYRTPPKKRSKSKHHKTISELERTIPKIKFLGVWDTVGALGVPIPGLRWISKLRVGFIDAALCSNIQFAYQALAIDEKRRPFAPDLWENVQKNGLTNDYLTEDICQVWFAGVHSNIGGGYPDCGLSDIAFTWMMKRAEDCGLAINPRYKDDKAKVDPRLDSPVKNSFTLPYQVLRPLLWKHHRPVGPERIKKGNAGMNEMLHESVLEKLQTDEKYKPKKVLSVKDQMPVFRENEYTPRATVRRPVGWKGTLTGNHKVAECRILDFGEGAGARIECEQRFKNGSITNLSTPKVGPLPSEIVWQKENLLGLKFV